MSRGSIRFCTFPRTEPPPPFAADIVAAFRSREGQVSSVSLPKGLTSDEVLKVLAPQLAGLGFEIERGKKKDQKVERPVFFGEDGAATLRYEIDAYHPEWRCGLEIEAGRAWMGNAVYRDLIQAALMVGIDHLCLAVPVTYKFKSSGRDVISKDYENTRDLAEAAYGHSRFHLPYRLIVVGY